jgi:hypothetical protein
MPVDAAGLVRTIPVAAFTLRGTLVIGTDSGEWLSIGNGDRVVPLADTGPISDVVDHGDGTLSVACWTPVLKQLRDSAWTDLSLSAPATALAMTPRGLVLADTGGGLSLLAGTSRVPVQELTSPEAIVQLVALDGGLAVLGTSGSVEVTTWPGAEGGLTPVHTGSIGRAHAIFAGLRRGTALVAGARGVGVLERQRLTSVSTDIGDRVAGVAVFHDRGRALLHADDGSAWIVDEGLARPARVRLGDGKVAGATSGSDGTVLVWTTDGVLHVVGHDGASWQVTDGGVVLALPEPNQIRGSIAIHWSASRGMRVTRGHVAWN